MLIPISPDSRYEYRDEENKITYYFKYLIGGKEQEMYEELTKSGIDIVKSKMREALEMVKKDLTKEKMPGALKEIKKEHPKIKGNALSEKVKERASELALLDDEELHKRALDVAMRLAEVEINQKESSSVRWSRKIISIFLADYKSDIPNVPKFDPNDPCGNLTISLINKLSTIIQELIPVLSGLTEDEVKN